MLQNNQLPSQMPGYPQQLSQQLQQQQQQQQQQQMQMQMQIPYNYVTPALNMAPAPPGYGVMHAQQAPIHSQRAPISMYPQAPPINNLPPAYMANYMPTSYMPPPLTSNYNRMIDHYPDSYLDPDQTDTFIEKRAHIRSGFQGLGKTKEYQERHYYSNTGTYFSIPLNQFWVDLVRPGCLTFTDNFLSSGSKGGQWRSKRIPIEPRDLSDIGYNQASYPYKTKTTFARLWSLIGCLGLRLENQDSAGHLSTGKGIFLWCFPAV